MGRLEECKDGVQAVLDLAPPIRSFDNDRLDQTHIRTWPNLL